MGVVGAVSRSPDELARLLAEWIPHTPEGQKALAALAELEAWAAAGQRLGLHVDHLRNKPSGSTIAAFLAARAAAAPSPADQEEA